MMEWLAMGGHGFFVWSSYGALAIALIVEITALGRARRNAIELARAVRAEQPRGRGGAPTPSGTQP